MKSFLGKVAGDIYQKHTFELHKTIVVLPGQRASLYFRKELSVHLKKPIWSPEIITIQNFLEAVSPISSTDPLKLLIELKKSYTEVFGKETSLSDFMELGQMILADFSEIDAYLIDPDKIFKNLREFKEVEEWSFSLGSLTPIQKEYGAFWEKLGLLYHAFTQRTDPMGIGYSGRIAQKAASNIKTWLKEKEDVHIHWVGSNALSNAERKIIDTLHRERKITLHWDIDATYFSDPEHEAGHFFRKYSKQEDWGKGIIPAENLKSLPDITLHEASDQISETRVAANLLKDLKQDELEKTAVVLCDESLLIPLLHGLPEEVSRANITMGMSLRLWPVFDLINNLFNAFGKKSEGGILVKDFLAVIQHPLLSPGKVYIENTRIFSNQLNQKRLDLLSPDFILKNLDEKLLFPGFLMEILIKPENDTIIEGITRWLKNLLNAWNKDGHDLEREQIFLAYRLFNRMSGLLEKENLILSLSDLQRVFQHLSKNYQISFLGEPLEGIQIMGVLETRAIDFERIIFIGVNEGSLPKSGKSPSVIPYELRKIFGLPTHKEREAIYAYHFYRLLHRAANVKIIYGTLTDAFGGGEKSRYISQLEEGYAPNRLPVTIHAAANNNKEEVKEIGKTPEAIEKMLQHLERGLSPSALNTYLTCPLDYYYKYVVGIPENANVENNLNQGEVGTFIHEALENVLKPFKNKVLTSVEYKPLLEKALHLLEEKFKSIFPGRPLQGMNYLTYEISRQLISRWMENEGRELKNQPLTLLYFEEKLSKELEITLNGEIKKIKLIGTADRIDKIGNTIRILDYKTGSVKPDEVKIKAVEDAINIEKPKGKAIQLLFYGLLFNGLKQEDYSIQPGIIALRNRNDQTLPLLVDKKAPEKKHFEEFEDILLELIQHEMLNVNIPFAHKHTSNYCAYCR